MIYFLRADVPVMFDEPEAIYRRDAGRRTSSAGIPITCMKDVTGFSGHADDCSTFDIG
jgi:hypothetical protein